MMYKEELPTNFQCPPAEAIEDEIPEAYRMVYNNPPTQKDFWSKKKLGEAMLSDDECGHASCSLNLRERNARRLAQMPKPREKGAMVAKVAIPAGSGRWMANKKKHVHFWMYAEFDPCSSIVEVVSVDA